MIGDEKSCVSEYPFGWVSLVGLSLPFVGLVLFSWEAIIGQLSIDMLFLWIVLHPFFSKLLND